MTTVKDGRENEIKSEETTTNIDGEIQNNVDHSTSSNVKGQHNDNTIITVDNYERQETKTEGDHTANNTNEMKICLEETVYKEKQIPQNQQTFIVAPAYRREDSDSYDDLFSSSFSELRIRNKFVRKVFTIVFSQLACTVISTCLAMFVPQIKEFVVVDMMPLFIIGIVMYFVSSLAIICCPRARRTYPLNYILLAGFTVAMCILILPVTALVDPINVLMALAITAAVCLFLTIFAMQTSWDVTGYGSYLYVALMVLFMFGCVLGILRSLGIDSNVSHIMYSAFGVMVFSFYLIYDVQQVMGGKRFQISEEEYILAALSIYIDIMYIFWSILDIIVRASR